MSLYHLKGIKADSFVGSILSVWQENDAKKKAELLQKMRKNISLQPVPVPNPDACKECGPVTRQLPPPILDESKF